MDSPIPTPATAGRRGYAICATPRCGSNYLGQVLASTGVLGMPLEYFNGPARRELEHPGYPDDPHQQLRAILDVGSTSNGVYAVKLFPHQFRAVQHARWPDVLPSLSFVHLVRDDVLGQALSYARATLTGRYRSTSSAEVEPRYDGDVVRQCLAVVVAEDARWRLWFARTGTEPLRLRYEDVVADPQGAADAVAALVGVTDAAPVLTDRIDLRVQRDAETERWRKRFLAEAGKRATIEPEFGRYGVAGPWQVTGARRGVRSVLSRLRTGIGPHAPWPATGAGPPAGRV